MGIRVNYGDIQKMGQLAVEAGRAEGSIIRADRAAQEAASVRSAAVQMASINAATERQIRDIEHQNDMVEYKSWLDQEAEKRARAWEVEKKEIEARDKFALNEQEFAIKKQAEMFMEEQKKEERRRKFNALDKLLESGEITSGDHQKERLRLELDLPATASPFVPQTLEQMAAEQARASMRKAAGIGTAAEAVSPIQGKQVPKSVVDAAVYDLSIPANTRTQIDLMRQLDVDDETYQEISRTVATKNPVLINSAFQKLTREVKVLAEKKSKKVAQSKRRYETAAKLGLASGQAEARTTQWKTSGDSLQKIFAR